tara:strand:+ start:207 stop:1211 length:1005 start_codon:yes stop_codon:yes gene_type:complete
MLVTNPIEEDVFERTMENEDEEKKYEKELARRRRGETSSSSSSSFAFLNEKKMGQKLEPKTIAIFLNSRMPLTICGEIVSLSRSFEKIGQVKTSNVSERNDCLTDDENNTNTANNSCCDIYYQKETNVALVECKYDVPVENATRWAETVLECLVLGGEMKTLQNAFVVTSFVSSFADDTDVDGRAVADENSFGSSRFAVQYVGNEAYTAEKCKVKDNKKKPFSVGRAVVGAEAALFNRLNQLNINATTKTKAKIALFACPDERSFSGTADDIIDVRALKNVVDVLRDDDRELDTLLQSVDENALKDWARRNSRQRQRNDSTTSASLVVDENLFS